MDGDEKTCWTHSQKAEKGSYFGLDLLHIQRLTQLSIVFQGKDKDRFISYYDRLQVHVSQNGTTWNKMDVKVESTGKINHFRYVPVTSGNVRFVRFVLSSNLLFPLTICEIQYISI